MFFCNPYSPWQRGSNENTNRLLRFWFEKGTDLAGYTKADLKGVQDKLNKRPNPPSICRPQPNASPPSSAKPHDKLH